MEEDVDVDVDVGVEPYPRWRKVMMFAFALGCIVAFITSASRLSPSLPGTVGALYRRNVEVDVESTALIYTESGDVRDYLDNAKGRYR